MADSGIGGDHVRPQRRTSYGRTEQWEAGAGRSVRTGQPTKKIGKKNGGPPRTKKTLSVLIPR